MGLAATRLAPRSSNMPMPMPCGLSSRSAEGAPPRPDRAAASQLPAGASAESAEHALHRPLPCPALPLSLSPGARRPPLSTASSAHTLVSSRLVSLTCTHPSRPAQSIHCADTNALHCADARPPTHSRPGRCSLHARIHGTRLRSPPCPMSEPPRRMQIDTLHGAKDFERQGGGKGVKGKGRRRGGAGERWTTDLRTTDDGPNRDAPNAAPLAARGCFRARGSRRRHGRAAAASAARRVSSDATHATGAARGARRRLVGARENWRHAASTCCLLRAPRARLTARLTARMHRHAPTCTMHHPPMSSRRLTTVAPARPQRNAPHRNASRRHTGRASARWPRPHRHVRVSTTGHRLLATSGPSD